MSVRSIVTSSWIVHTVYLLWEPQQNITKPDLTENTMPDQVQGTTMKTRTGEVIPDHKLICTDIAAQVITIHTEVAPGHDIAIITATPGVAQDAHPTHIEITAINPAMTHHTDHITDHPHIGSSSTYHLEDHVHVHPTNLQGEISTGHIHILADHKANHTSRRT